MAKLKDGYFKQLGSAVGSDLSVLLAGGGSKTLADLYKDPAFTGSASIESNLTVGGNLIINGTTITINSTTVTIDDPILTLGGDTAPTVNDGKYRGIEFKYFDTVARTGFFGYDNSAGNFTFLKAATNSSEVFSGTLGDVVAANFTGNKFIVSGGTSTQFLKGDGSLDSTTYLSLAGGSLLGALTITGTTSFVPTSGASLQINASSTNAPRIQSYNQQSLYINELGNSIILGTEKYTISEDGGQYSGNAATSTSSKQLFSNGGLTTAPGDGKLNYTFHLSTSVAGLFPVNNNSNAIITLNRHEGNYDSQLGFSSNGNIYYRSFNGVALDTTTAWRTVWDSGNSNLSTVNWTTNALTAEGVAKFKLGIYTGNKTGYADGVAGVVLSNSGSIELSGAIPFIDFHFNNSTNDFTSRIIENFSGQLSIANSLRIGDIYVQNAGGEALYVNGTSKFTDSLTGTNTSFSDYVSSYNYNRINGTGGTGDAYLELWRGTNASWKILNTGDALKFQSNYTTVVGSYYDVISLSYNSGNVWIKGNVTASNFIGNASTATSAVDSDKLDGLHSTSFIKGDSKSYSSASISGDDGTDGWYTLFSINDSTNSPIMCSLKAYAHTSILFSISKGYGDGSPVITILNASTGSANVTYKYIKGIRLITGGKIQIKLNGGANSSLAAQIFGASSSVALEPTLVKDTTSPTVLRVIDPIQNEAVTSSGEFYSGANKVWHAGNSNITSVNWSAGILEAVSGVKISQTVGSGVGLSLYGNSAPTNPTYGMMFALTSLKGTHGGVTGDWATYITMNDQAYRGWIFTKNSAGTTGNVASINTDGKATFDGGVSTTTGEFTVSVTAPSFIGNASTSTSTTLLKRIGDKRDSFKPSDIPGSGLIHAFSTQGGINNQVNDSDYSDVIGISSYQDSTAGSVSALSFDKSSFRINHFMGGFGGTTWTGYKTLAYTDGTGASGTWGISVTGNSATATQLSGTLPQIAAATENNIISVIDDGNGAITTNSPVAGMAAIRHGFSFKWYSDDYHFGIIRGGSSDSKGLGVTLGASTLLWMVKNDTIAHCVPTYINNTLNVNGELTTTKNICLGNSAENALYSNNSQISFIKYDSGWAQKSKFTLSDLGVDMYVGSTKIAGVSQSGITSQSFIKSGGTVNEILLANGQVVTVSSIAALDALKNAVPKFNGYGELNVGDLITFNSYYTPVTMKAFSSNLRIDGLPLSFDFNIKYLTDYSYGANGGEVIMCTNTQTSVIYLPIAPAEGTWVIIKKLGSGGLTVISGVTNGIIYNQGSTAANLEVVGLMDGFMLIYSNLRNQWIQFKFPRDW